MVLLSLDASTDINNTAQLMIFIHWLNNKLEVTEELTSINGLHGTSTDKDIFKKAEKTVISPYSSLLSVYPLQETLMILSTNF